MRLICPNCGAQYEVPEEVMPAEGRDVQCSNCGQTWFQDHPDTITEREAIRTTAPHDDEEVVKVALEPFEDATEPKVGPEIERPEEKPEAEEPKKRELDPSVADVLREEAELETRARQSEAGPMESQPDLGLAESSDETDDRPRETRDRMALMRGETPPSDAVSALASRRDLLPDIEEINSTLRSNSNRSPNNDPGQTAQIEVQEKRSSRRGFILTIALVAALALLYTYAPQLAEAVPATEPALASYVAIVDSWRVWVDEQVSVMLTWLDNAAASSSE